MRSQLPEENALYRYDAEADKVETIDQAFVDAQEARHCALCGLAGAVSCDCTASCYCSTCVSTLPTMLTTQALPPTRHFSSRAGLLRRLAIALR